MVSATRTGHPTGFMTRSPGTEPSAQPRWENTAGFIMPDLGTGCQDGERHSILWALTPLYCWSEKNLASTGTTRSCWNLQPDLLMTSPALAILAAPASSLSFHPLGCCSTQSQEKAQINRISHSTKCVRAGLTTIVTCLSSRLLCPQGPSVPSPLAPPNCPRLSII